MKTNKSTGKYQIEYELMDRTIYGDEKTRYFKGKTMKQILKELIDYLKEMGIIKTEDDIKFIIIKTNRQGNHIFKNELLVRYGKAK